ncbi:MAG: universal stress protein [Dehalococcoidales bacterium]|nr:universal stress protein [Dehalococcoidales bacterium]
MYKKILVVLDGSQLAEVVFPYAKEFAGRLGLDVVLLHVYQPERKEFAPMYQTYISKAVETIQTMAREVQINLTGQTSTKLVNVRGELVMGYHADEIIRYAEENNIDFILMANHGRSGIKQWSLGGVADKVLRASKIPVWVVHAGIPDAIPYDRWPSRTILVPLNGSNVSETVLPHAIEIARHKGPVPLDVVLLEVCEPPTPPTYYSPELTGVPLNWGKFMEEETARKKQAATEYLVKTAEQFKTAGIGNITSVVLVGKPADEIINYANKHPFTVVVMATHGRSGFSRLVYGSVAESVLFGITNPLVLIKPQ